MKRAIDWFSNIEDVKLRDKLLNNTIRFPNEPNAMCYDFDEALLIGFDWKKTPEGEDYWRSYYYGVDCTTNPSHYKSMDKEVWEIMVMVWGKEAFIKHCEMTAFKYRMRAGKKSGNSVEQDMNKAKWYEDKAAELKGKV